MVAVPRAPPPPSNASPTSKKGNGKGRMTFRAPKWKRMQAPEVERKRNGSRKQRRLHVKAAAAAKKLQEGLAEEVSELLDATPEVRDVLNQDALAALARATPEIGVKSVKRLQEVYRKANLRNPSAFVVKHIERISDGSHHVEIPPQGRSNGMNDLSAQYAADPIEDEIEIEGVHFEPEERQDFDAADSLRSDLQRFDEHNCPPPYLKSTGRRLQPRQAPLMREADILKVDPMLSSGSASSSSSQGTPSKVPKIGQVKLPAALKMRLGAPRPKPPPSNGEMQQLSVPESAVARSKSAAAGSSSATQLQKPKCLPHSNIKASPEGETENAPATEPPKKKRTRPVFTGPGSLRAPSPAAPPKKEEAVESLVDRSLQSQTTKAAPPAPTERDDEPTFMPPKAKGVAAKRPILNGEARTKRPRTDHASGDTENAAVPTLPPPTVAPFLPPPPPPPIRARKKQDDHQHQEISMKEEVDKWEARSDASDSWPDPSAGWEQHGSKGKMKDERRGKGGEKGKDSNGLPVLVLNKPAAPGTLLLERLPASWGVSQIRPMFMFFGAEEVYLAKDPRTDSRVAVVRLKNPENAQKVADQVSSTEVGTEEDGGPYTISCSIFTGGAEEVWRNQSTGHDLVQHYFFVDELAMPSRPHIDPSPHDVEVFVDNLPFDQYTEYEMTEWLSTFGDIADQQFLRDHLSGQFTGQAYIRFTSHEVASAFIAAQDPPTLDNRITAAWSESERLLQGVDSVYKSDIHATLQQIISTADVQELWMLSEVRSWDTWAPKPKGKQLHLLASCSREQYMHLRRIFADAIAAFHEGLAKLIPNDASAVPAPEVVTGWQHPPAPQWKQASDPMGDFWQQSQGVGTKSEVVQSEIGSSTLVQQVAAQTSSSQWSQNPALCGRLDEGEAAVAAGRASKASGDFDQAYRKFFEGIQILKAIGPEIQQTEGVDTSNGFYAHIKAYVVEARSIKAELDSKAAAMAVNAHAAALPDPAGYAAPTPPPAPPLAPTAPARRWPGADMLQGLEKQIHHVQALVQGGPHDGLEQAYERSNAALQHFADELSKLGEGDPLTTPLQGKINLLWSSLERLREVVEHHRTSAAQAEQNAAQSAGYADSWPPSNGASAMAAQSSLPIPPPPSAPPPQLDQQQQLHMPTFSGYGQDQTSMVHVDMRTDQPPPPPPPGLQAFHLPTHWQQQEQQWQSSYHRC